MTRRVPASHRRPEASTSPRTGNGNSAGVAPWSLMADFSRQQFAVSTEAASLMFKGSEAIRKIQQQAAHEASLRHQAALQKLQAGGDPADLLAVQTELLRFDVEQASQYWQQLAQTAVQTQMEVLGCAGHLFNGETANHLRAAMQAFQPHPPQAGGSGPAPTGS